MFRTSLVLSDSNAEALKELATRRGVTMAEILRQAVGNELYFDKIRSEDGKILVENKEGKVRQVVFR